MPHYIEESINPSNKIILELNCNNKKSKCEIYLFGSHVVNFTTTNELNQEKKHIWMSKDSKMNGTTPLRGGIPIAFPQFANRGPLSKGHGFAREMLWSLISINSTFDDNNNEIEIAILELKDNEETRLLWNHSFILRYTIELRLTSLTLHLDVINSSNINEFDFGSCLHTYLYTNDSNTISLIGLQGVDYIDKLDNKIKKELHNEIILDRAAIDSNGYIDRIYLDAPNNVILKDPSNEIIYNITKSNSFHDIVVWNPWNIVNPKDFGNNGHKTMLCVEASNTGAKKTTKLLANETWRGTQVISV